jgi:4-aminobutyrate aminotransferase-like enzyme/Ser/Thr protein kinase RdoA (MazF antagonist)
MAVVGSPWGAAHVVRLVTWLPGIVLVRVRHRSPALLEDLGRRVAELDRALLDFDHPAIHRIFHWDLARASDVIRKRIALVADPALCQLVEDVAARACEALEARGTSLRRSAIHNDANDWNVLAGGGTDLYTRNQRVVGIIDFGDIVHSWTAADPAVAMAYAMLDRADPLADASHVLRGYHAANPLNDDEIGALYAMVSLRLCLSVAVAASQRRQRPDDEYLAVSQAPIRRLLPRIAALHPRFAEAVFRRACGLPVSEHAGRVASWLQSHSSEFAPVLDGPMEGSRVEVLDLSVGSARVSNGTIDWQQGEAVGIGRYGEARLPSPSDPSEGGGLERRTVHLGMDLFVSPGTRLHAPIAGVVHAFGDNRAPLDYGPVIILRHETGAGDLFFTLYGHLSRESLEGLRVGRRIARGEAFASVGATEVNGGWVPHVHFQVITDLLDRDLDYPGVCRSSERDVWCAFSPDPNAILGVPPSAFPAPPPRKTDMLDARRARIGRNLSIGYRDPVNVARGWMQYLYDQTGRRYIDGYNNVPHVGHCHPRVVEAGLRQMGVLNTNTRYLHESLARYAERLTRTLPEPLRVCFFVNSGSEANELALRLARTHTGRRDLVVLDGAYHGNTTTLVEISPYKFNRPGGGGGASWVHVAPLPDLFRGAHRRGDPRAGVSYAASVGEVVQRVRESDGLCGFIAESCPSTAGQIMLPPGYLDAVYAHVREAGGVCIADEVQTAYGRIGTHFYGFQSQGVVPDVVVLGKPIGNGHPIGAVITTPEIARSFDRGMEFFSTFGGNTVSCAIGLEVLDVVEEERLQAHALRVGVHLLRGLRPLVDRFAVVGDVRGSGLFVGVELVRNRETLEPAAEEASFVVNRLREEGILIGTDGVHHNVLKIRPPMPFNESDADSLVSTLERVLSEEWA